MERGGGAAALGFGRGFAAAVLGLAAVFVLAFAFGFALAAVFGLAVAFGAAVASAVVVRGARLELRRVGRLSGRLPKTSWSPVFAGSVEAMARIVPELRKRRRWVTAS